MKLDKDSHEQKDKCCGREISFYILGWIKFAVECFKRKSMGNRRLLWKKQVAYWLLFPGTADCQPLPAGCSVASDSLIPV